MKRYSNDTVTFNMNGHGTLINPNDGLGDMHPRLKQ